ncbi:MAG: single-stranded DNA-binding protein [Lautropia sp.]|nr:single-stranded DNA-binding protein [Lautropia sp.]
MLNQVQLIGHLGRDPVVRYSTDGSAFAHISLATSEHWTDKTSGERREATEWHRVTFFGRLAEVVSQYLNKGSLVYVSGRLRTRKYADNDGVDRYATEVMADSLKMLGRRGGTSDAGADPELPAGRSAPAAPRRSSQPPPDDIDSDIPF